MTTLSVLEFMKPGVLQKLLERLDRLDGAELETYLMKLVEEKGFLEKTFQALHEGVILLDASAKASYINPAACRMFGVEPERVLGADLRNSLGGGDWTQDVKGGGSISRDFEIHYPETRHLNFHISAIDPDEDIGYVILVRDVTEHRQSTEKQIESERFSALTMMAAGVAHELGNPLNSLTIHLQLLGKKLKKHPAAFRAVSGILETSLGEIRRLDGLIESFLRAARPSPPRLQPSDVMKLVAESAAFLAPEFEDRGTMIDVEGPPRPLILPLDADQMKQVFYNLFRNAMQAMGSGGKIEVSAERSDGIVTVRFHDTGSGMSAEQVSGLFQPYVTTKAKGTGIGLIIVRRIVRDHGGDMEIVSKPGQGTTILLHLPDGTKRAKLLAETTSPVP